MKRFLVALPVAALAWSPALAQEVPPYNPDPGPVAGNWEWTLTGSGLSSKEFDNNNFGFTTSIGYFWTKNILFSFRQSIAFSVGSDVRDTWAGSSRVAADYQFDFGRWQPFIGVNLGGVYGKDVRGTGSAGPEAGLKYYVNESTFAFGMAEYQISFRDGIDEGVLVYSVGLGVNF
ncbi:MAG: hypothetical protein EA405_04510 [Rhodospirillales bacterium]|nr:MAG: hypothetical protein EA405_04510 [Rhodospirillales bacterium]